MMPPTVKTVIVHADDLVEGMAVIARAAYEAWGEWAAFTLVCRPDKEVWELTADVLFDEEEDDDLDEDDDDDEEEDDDE